MMLADAKVGNVWAAPISVSVVSSMTERDNLENAGHSAGIYTTSYRYHEAVYDGRQREFRGFRRAEATSVGDATVPSSISSTQFLLGECVDEAPGDGVDQCSISERWRDNPREALKGLAV